MKVHRLVAMAFCSVRSEEKNYVNHVDRDRKNNHYSNLEWCSSSENRNHDSHVLKVLESIKHSLTTGVKHAEIAEKYKVDKATVSRIAGANDLKRENKLSEDLRKSILKDLKDEVTANKVAEKYKVGITTVLNLAKANGVKPLGRRLPAAKRDRVLSLLATGLSQSEVARTLGIDRGTVSLIARG